jgi:hypothetical protein
VKLIYQGAEYELVDPNDVDTDEAEQIEEYTGHRYSQTFDADILNSDIKILKIRIWLILRRSVTDPGPLKQFKARLGDVDFQLDEQEQKAIDEAVKADAEDPTKRGAGKARSGAKARSESVSTP